MFLIHSESFCARRQHCNHRRHKRQSAVGQEEIGKVQDRMHAKNDGYPFFPFQKRVEKGAHAR